MLTASLSLLQAETATAQKWVTVDGDARDWAPLGHLSASDWPNDVTPDTNRTVDLRGYDYDWGGYGPRGDLFAFIFRFADPPFQGSDPTTVELFFDVSTDTTFGDLTTPWQVFSPEYRFIVTGQEDRLTSESYLRYAGGQWCSLSEGADITELDIALLGQYLEGTILWSALGSLPPPDYPSESLAFRWAVQVSQGPYRDYMPDVTGGGYPFSEFFTNIEAYSWGMVKRLYD